jgi:hypothetical protein
VRSRDGGPEQPHQCERRRRPHGADGTMHAQ